MKLRVAPFALLTLLATSAQADDPAPYHAGHDTLRPSGPRFSWHGAPPPRTPLDPAAAALHHWRERIAKEQGPELARRAMESVQIAHVHDTGRGGLVVTLRQHAGGVPMWRHDAKVLLDRSGRALAFSGTLVTRPPRVAASRLSPAQAVRRAFADLFAAPPPTLREIAPHGGFQRFELVKAGDLVLSRPARARPVLFPLPGEPAAAYYLELVGGPRASTSASGYAYVIAADDGRLLYRRSIVHNDAFTYRVWARPDGDRRPFDGPLADHTPHPTGIPDGSYPAFIGPSVVSMDAFNQSPNGTTDSWLPPGATVADGNNVYVYTDHQAPNGFSPGDVELTATAPGTFNRVYNTQNEPLASVDQSRAALTQLFYVNNWLHDWWYDSGFDEAAGNAQRDNFGRGGLDGDPLLGEGQDGALEGAVNNANMLTPEDGSSPVMQTFVWDGPEGGPQADATIDSLVIAHEWGHYLHHRLVDCGVNQCDSQSEGWADFVGVHLARGEGDPLGSVYAGAAYYAPIGFFDPGYYGLRRAPYSVDPFVNGFHFLDMANSTPSPSGFPSLMSGAPNAEVHNSGEVWALMLLEGYEGLLTRTEGAAPAYDFAEAQRRMADYIVAGMVLAPADPTFTEQRDALLAAARSHDEGDFTALAQGFANRGAGSCAVSPPRNSVDHEGIVESYEVAGALAVRDVRLTDDVLSCDDDGVVDRGEEGTVRLEAVNVGPLPLGAGTVTASTAAAGVTLSAPVQAVPALEPGETAELAFPIAVGHDATAASVLTLAFAPSTPGGCAVAPAPAHFRIDADDVEEASAEDAFDSRLSVWTPTGNEADIVWSREEVEPGDGVWRGIDLGRLSDTSLVSPPLAVGSEPLTVTLTHRYDFEAEEETLWDGGVIEISTDDGQSWQDVEAFDDPGYGGVLSDLADNPLAGRMAFVAESPGFPGTTTTTLSFGTVFAGESVRLRFRIGTDQAVSDFGWEIGRVAFAGLSGTPFPVVEADGTACFEPPVAVAGPDQTVDEGQLVVLDGSASFDPEGEPLTHEWQQTAGEPVELGGAGAIRKLGAPHPSEPTTLTFELTVSDGALSDSDSLTVTVLPRVPDAEVEVRPHDLSGRGCACGLIERGRPAPWWLVGLGGLVMARRTRRARDPSKVGSATT